MSRTYKFKPSIKKRDQRARVYKRVRLEDYEIEYLETSLGNSIKLSV